MSEENTQTSRDADAAPKRPVNPDGTTNWEVVFNDPGRGVLVMIDAVTTVEQLRKVMESVALLLFKRRHDAQLRANFSASVAEITDGEDAGDLQIMKSEIGYMLRMERDIRVEKAETYSKNKRTSQALERRRKKAEGGGLGAMLFGSKVRRIISFSTIAAVVALSGIIAMMSMDVSEIFEAERLEAPAIVVEHDEKPEPEEPKPAPKPVQKAPPVRLEWMLAMRPLALGVNIDGQARRLELVPMFKVDETEDVTAFCELAPWVIEGVTLGVHQMTASGKDATPYALQALADKIRADVNANNNGKLPPMSIVGARGLSRAALIGARSGCARVSIEKAE